MGLAHRIRNARKRAGMTLRQVSDASGISVTYLCDMENDTEEKGKPSADTLIKVANALSVGIGELLGVNLCDLPKGTAEINSALAGFISRMQAIGQPLRERDIAELAEFRFRDCQPQTIDDWHDLFRVLDRMSGHF